MHTHHKPAAKTAFTLVELLVVIAIIGVLAALGLSVTSAAMEKSKATKCRSSLRQIGVAIRAYVGDHDGRLPDTGHVRAEDGTSLSWLNTLSTYLGPKFIGRCPSNTQSPVDVTYAWNDLLTETHGEGIPAVRCRTQSATLAVGESADSYTTEHFHFATSRSRVTFNQFKASAGVERHGTGANYLFVDGHVESLTPAEVKARLDATESAFLIP
jgi:prepilin-type processing-associated H-X9-DG protein/prepilin-type N-terminal cleavage/methylation domain-containing protein